MLRLEQRGVSSLSLARKTLKGAAGSKVLRTLGIIGAATEVINLTKDALQATRSLYTR